MTRCNDKTALQRIHHKLLEKAKKGIIYRQSLLSEVVYELG